MASHGRRRLWLALAATAVLVLPVAWLWWSSLLPDSYDMAEMGYADWGGGPVGEHASMEGMAGMHTTPVSELTADPDRTADVRATFTVRREDDGGYTVNGTSPGPLLEATLGDLVEVTLVNDNVEEGTTLHWHGVDVPNAEDGVAGVTQDAVMPGEEFVYRFVADQAGTFWYHSHQVSHEQVRQGLLGPLVVRPEQTDQGVVDEVAVIHQYDEGPTVNGESGVVASHAQVGQEVRLRVVNTDNGVNPVWVTGAPYRVLAVDGTDVNQPDEVTGDAYAVPAGGRVDLGFTVPRDGVRVDLGGSAAMTFAGDPTGGTQAIAPDSYVDLLSYGEPADLDFDPTQPDRDFEYTIGKKPGFLDGMPGLWWTVNGHLYPDVPMFMVSEGDVVTFAITNDSDDAHPMHLHGHHAVVLSRDGEPATGSPWWTDSLEVGVGETYEIAFVADNPGLWMDHCHNLPHAQNGLVAHLMYDGVTSSFRVGDENRPE
ncbi:multicopper oxidase family protein [Nocardioides taihuensis]|uniref:Multicopper oxidase family protein n=1 Tax=Nocardioides taihuensis TaxID=1835606 RepID=A0ABW0BNR6_9ACTN